MDLTPSTRSQRDLDRDVVIDIAQRGDHWGRIARRMLAADEAASRCPTCSASRTEPPLTDGGPT